MRPYPLKDSLCFYFITDHKIDDFQLYRQVETALLAGATMVQYRNKEFGPGDFEELIKIRDACRRYSVPLVINDDILLAKAVDADGVHLGQDDSSPALARRIMGPDAIIGISASTPSELAGTDLDHCDYIGCGPVFPTKTKADHKPVIGVSGLSAMVSQSPVPVVAIGGIDAGKAGLCFDAGAAGVAVISTITRSSDPKKSAVLLAEACGCKPRTMDIPWKDEFWIISEVIRNLDSYSFSHSAVSVGGGDDAALLLPLRRPVITTDTQRDGVHFNIGWMSYEDIGRRAVMVSLSDLAASYAVPVSIFCNIGLPADMSQSAVSRIFKGIDKALGSVGASLGGGNISSARRLVIDIFAVGEGDPELFPLRSRAMPGYGLYVTGPLGLARAGLECVRNSITSYPGLVERFIHPDARFDAAEILKRHGVDCVMDVSDGLAGDAGHIASASGITIRLEPESFCVHAELERYCAEMGKAPEAYIASGGEDYELLFACEEELFFKIKKEMPDSHRVGKCIPFSGSLIKGLKQGVSSYIHRGCGI